jgi:release factor glutamine methyltransferase
VSALAFAGHECRAGALVRVAAALAEAGIEEPQREARLLLCAALDLPLADLIAHGEVPLGGGALRLEKWLHRRLNREPLSRIRGHREFRGRLFETSPAVLDPRPETELLVDAGLARLKASGRPGPRILDLGTGSGAIIVSLLAECIEATGVAVDISAEALAIAGRNSVAHGVSGRLTLLSGDLLAPVTGVFDLIVSNPPYIPSGDLAALDAEVRDFDPVLALDGGADGLDFYRRIIKTAPSHLTPGGILALELGIHQAGPVSALARGAGFSDIVLHPDYSGIERHLTAQWKNR